MGTSADALTGGGTAEERPSTPTQAELEAALDAAEVEVAAGRAVPLEPVLADMRAVAERIRRDRAD